MDEVAKLRDSNDRWRVQIESKINSHHLTLYGNGKPGLDEEVRNINSKLDVLIKLAWIVSGAVIAAGVAFGLAAIKYLAGVMGP